MIQMFGLWNSNSDKNTPLRIINMICDRVMVCGCAKWTRQSTPGHLWGGGCVALWFTDDDDDDGLLIKFPLAPDERILSNFH